ncbi:MAG TPA: hypothetical protein PLU30_19625 [Verrucomicrobiae bacterium]|nr:hypothetical protein [Verrucomicrobiae bacterium]
MAMVIGAIDPLEGSVIILVGSGLVAFGAFLGRGERRLFAYRLWVFVLIAIGVGALWGLSAVGGFGGQARSVWWGMLVLPYVIGWLMGICGPGSPRWLLWLGIGVGLWYVTILAMVLSKAFARPGMSAVPAVVIACIGVLTIGACIYRLRKRTTG